MKCRVTRDLGVCPEWQSPLIVVRNQRRIIASGTEIDQGVHPETNVVALIRNGEAIPVDDEAREACGMSPGQIVAAQAALSKMYAVDTHEEDDDESDGD